mgnify:CR=1 FL=1
MPNKEMLKALIADPNFQNDPFSFALFNAVLHDKLTYSNGTIKSSRQKATMEDLKRQYERQ